MPTKYKLSREQEEAVINWAIEHGLVKPDEEQETKPQVLIDKYGLLKLFWNTKFRDPKPGKKMPQLVVRCDRVNKTWMVTVQGAKKPKRHTKGSLVLSDVKFIHKLGTEQMDKEVYLGCGIYDNESVEVHTGFASGQYEPQIKPKAIKGGRQLRYDREEGKFTDAETGQKVDQAAYLVLMEACRHSYIPMPEAK